MTISPNVLIINDSKWIATIITATIPNITFLHMFIPFNISFFYSRSSFSNSLHSVVTTYEDYNSSGCSTAITGFGSFSGSMVSFSVSLSYITLVSFSLFSSYFSIDSFSYLIFSISYYI